MKDGINEINIEVFTKNNVVLKKNSQCLVEVEFGKHSLNQGESIIIEPISPTPEGTLVAKSLHSINSLPQFCTILNFTDKDITLEKKVIIGKLSTYHLPEAEIVAETTPKSFKQQIRDIEALKLGDQLTEYERLELRAKLLRFHESFQWDEESCGGTILVEHGIDTGGHKQIVQRQYPLPTIAKQALLDQVEDMKKRGFK